MDTIKTARHLLADRILRDSLGKSLREWVIEHRAGTAERPRLTPMAWGQLAKKLAVATNGEVAVTQLTLRSWFAEELAAVRAENEDQEDETEREVGLPQEPLFSEAS